MSKNFFIFFIFFHFFSFVSTIYCLNNLLLITCSCIYKLFISCFHLPYIFNYLHPFTYYLLMLTTYSLIFLKNKKLIQKEWAIFKQKKIGNLLSSLTLFSPLKCLTSLFGMGRGVSTLLSSPIKCIITQLFTENKIMWFLSNYIND